MTIVNIGICILSGILVIIVILLLLLMLTHVWLFHRHKCPHCNHIMEYKGLKEDDGEGHYLFHCHKCGAWQQISKEQFFRDVEESEVVNPYNNNVL